MGGSGNDQLYGGAGNDTIDAGNGNNIIDAGAGDDVITAGSGDDTIDAGGDDDIIHYYGGNDTIDGLSGNDTVVIHTGNNGDVLNINGGNDNDTIDLSAFTDDKLADDGSTIAVDLGNDESFDVNYTGIENIMTGGSANNPPVAANDTYNVAEDGILNVNANSGVLANDTDLEGDDLIASLVSDVSNGTLQLDADGSFQYTPDADFNGQDNFTYQVSDGQGGTDTGTVAITVQPANDAPAAIADNYNVTEDGSLSVDADSGVLANDTDLEGDDLSASLVSDVSNGTLQLDADGSFQYTPEADFNGQDNFTYQVSDGQGGTQTGTVAITVEPVAEVNVPAPTNGTPVPQNPVDEPVNEIDEPVPEVEAPVDEAPVPENPVDEPVNEIDEPVPELEAPVDEAPVPENPAEEPLDDIDYPVPEEAVPHSESIAVEANMFEHANKTTTPLSDSDTLVTESNNQETDQTIIEMPGQNSAVEDLARDGTENLRELNPMDDMSQTVDIPGLQGNDQLVPDDIFVSSMLGSESELQYEVSEEITLPNNSENAALRSEPVPVDTAGATFDEVFEEPTENLQLVQTSGSPAMDGSGYGGLFAKIWGLITASGGVMKNTDNSHNVVEKREYRR
ncbi:MAG: tandem-95 repeat protein [Planctomycetota bacterium]